MKISKLVVIYLRKQPKRTLSLVISILIATALITTIGIISGSLKSNLIEDARSTYGDYYAQYKNLDNKKLDLLKHIDIFDNAGESISYGSFVDEKKGIKLNLEAPDKKMIKMLNTQLLKGGYPEKADEICLDQSFLDKMKIPLKIGQKIPLELSNGYEVNGKWKEYKFNKTFILKGILKTHPGSKLSGTSSGTVYLDAVLNDLPKEFINYQYFVKISENKSIDKALLDITEVQNKLNIKEEDVFINSGFTEVIRNNVDLNMPTILLSFIVVIASIAVIYNIFNISVIARIRDYGVFRCLGFRPSKIRKIIIFEALMLSIFSIPFGLLLGYLISKGMYGKITQLSYTDITNLTFSYKVFLVAALVSFIAVFISTLLPARYASKVSPLEAVRNTNASSVAGKFKAKKWHFLINKYFGASGSFAYKNLWRNKKRTYITVFSLGFTITLFIVFTYYFMKFPMYDPSENFKTGEYKFNIVDSAPNDVVYNKKHLQLIKNIEGVKNTVATQYTFAQVALKEKNITKEFSDIPNNNLEIDGANYRLQGYMNGYTNEMLKDLKKYIIKGELDESSFNGNNEIIINKTKYTDALKVNVGDKVTLRRYYKKNKADKENSFEDKVFKVTAFVSDMPYAVTKSGLGIPFIVGSDTFKNFTKINGYKQFDIKVGEGADNVVINEKLSKISENIDRSTYLSYFKEIQTIKDARKNITLLMYSFIGFIALISILNIVNTMNTNIIMRIKEFGTLRAIGFNKNHIKRIVLFEGMFYGIISAVLGIIFSSIARMILYNTVEGMKKGAPLIPMIAAFFVSIIMSILASMIPLRKISSMNIIEAVRDIE